MPPRPARVRLAALLALLLPVPARSAGASCLLQGLQDAWSLLVVGQVSKQAQSENDAELLAEEEGAARLPSWKELVIHGASRGPREPSWFESFEDVSNEESMVGRDFPPSLARLQRYNPIPKQFFHESLSAGPAEAWQTHYPAVGSSLQSPRTVDLKDAATNRQWSYVNDAWVIEHGPEPPPLAMGREGRVSASWFDLSVGDRDAYGRAVPPGARTPQALMKGEGGDLWFERSVNTTVNCVERECLGQAMLQAYDPATEEATNCRLNIGVHPTDFDNRFSRESIEYWWVNKYVVRSQCTPIASACGKRRPLISCLREYPVDHIINKATGAMLIEGKLSKMVDECPYNGHLLSSVAQVTCLVRPKSLLERPGELANETKLKTPDTYLESCQRYTSLLRCREPGCVAEATLRVEPLMAYLGGTFTMNITLVVTDFDQSESEETVEYVALEGLGMLGQKLVPPVVPQTACCCRARMAKKPRDTFQVLTNYDITTEVRKAKPLKVSAKISEMVDECDSDGWLLDGFVEVACTPPSEGGVLQT